MLQWLIKLLPITSAKCVNTQLRPSVDAQLVHAAAWLLIVWASLVVSLPLVLLPVLLSPLWRLCLTGTLLPVAAQGELRYAPRRKMVLGQKHITFSRCQTFWSHWFVVIYSEQNVAYTIWRDSMQESDYRHLLVLLKQAH